MKLQKTTFINSLRTFAIIISLFSFSYSFSQNGIIWTQANNIEDLEIIKNGERISSNNIQVQELINNFSINNIQRALPASRKNNLQNVVEITCNCDENELLKAVDELSGIFFKPEIGPHYQTLALPDDYTLSFVDDYALELINAESAWNITHGDSSIVIAVSDQNFVVNHEELLGKTRCYDSTNTAPQGHGTAVAVTAAGNTDNGIGKSSIGYNSDLALYIMSYNELLVATYNGYRVINASWASGCASNGYIQGVIDEVYENGSIVVAAAGNGGTCGGAMNLVYPAACDHVISVTGIGANDNHEITAGDTMSTFQHNNTVDISAPGIMVPLTMGIGYYLSGNGTSFAAPLVSGTIALMLSVDSCLTFEDIEAILYSTAVDIDNLNPLYAGRLGNGRLNAGAAVTMASTYFSCNGGVDPNAPLVDVADEDLEFVDAQSQSTVGIEENDTSLEIVVYPNPSKLGNTITIKSNVEISNCEITNMNGEKIREIVASNGNLKINELSQGAYFVKINLENGASEIKRIIVF